MKFKTQQCKVSMLHEKSYSKHRKKHKQRIHQSDHDINNSQNPRTSDSQNHVSHNGEMLRASLTEITIQRNIISPEPQQPPMNTNHIATRGKILNRKRSIRRLCLLVCVATIVALVIAGIAAVAILATKTKAESSTSITTVAPSTRHSTTTTTMTSTTTTSSSSTTTTTSSTSTSTVTTTISSTTTSSSTSTVSETTTTSSSTTSTVSATSTSTSTSSSTSSATSTSSTTTTTDTTTTTITTTTTTTTTTATTTSNCASTRPSSLLLLKNDTNTNWTQYTYNYTATKIGPILLFGSYVETNVYILLDDVSVVANANPSVQLLNNGGFENSSSTFPGWNFWCQYRCDSSSYEIITGINCRTSRCYKGQCTNGGSTSTFRAEYLVQSFLATIGQSYSISFWFRRVSNGSNPGDATFTASIV